MAINNQIQTGTSVIPLLGVTDASSASAGIIGQLISSVVSSGSAVSCSNGTARNVTSISVTAGDWNIIGNVFFNGSVVTNPTYRCWISATSASLPDNSLISLFNASLLLTGIDAGINAPFFRTTINSTTTIYLSCQANFSAGTVTACGGIYARRIR